MNTVDALVMTDLVVVIIPHALHRVPDRDHFPPHRTVAAIAMIAMIDLMMTIILLRVDPVTIAVVLPLEEDPPFGRSQVLGTTLMPARAPHTVANPSTAKTLLLPR